VSQGFDKEKPEFQDDLLSGPVRTNFNAVATDHAGPSAPSNPEEGWTWFDTSIPTNLKVKKFFSNSWHTILENVQAGPAAQSAAAKHVHTQASPSLTWTINHTLSTRELIVTVWDGTNKVMIPNEIEAVTTTQVVITFVSLQSGKAVLIG
jgi:hypothetical protein